MKLIVELSENDYNALKEDGVQNHLALADTIIACSVPYEERPKGEWKNCGVSAEGVPILGCSVCGRQIATFRLPDKYPFCNCGADMRNEK